MSAHIRNFSIIAHIDHGKSTLADRLLERTGTIEKRQMKEQVLDSMELERERGITIKMQPVRMKYTYENTAYTLNLIDTPGHIDFSYEVSRALKAVEGSILLIDATQGVQAQTLTTLSMARDIGLVIVPAVSKIDSPLARTEEVILEVAKLLNCDPGDVLKVSGKTGEGIDELLAEVIKRIPPPTVHEGKKLQALIFDFQYSNHRGVTLYVRIFEGSVTQDTKLRFCVADSNFICGEVGVFQPQETPAQSLSAGEIGYIVSGIKQPGIASVGDTVCELRDTTTSTLEGYKTPKPVVWASIFPESQDDLPNLRQALERLKLTDASLTYEEESSGTLGRGFRCGFLGMLHLEIVTERLKREHDVSLIITLPTVTYKVLYTNGKEEIIYSPSLFPEEHVIKEVFEPWVEMRIITPIEYFGQLMPLLHKYEAQVTSTDMFGDSRGQIICDMPLRELMRDFFNEVKSTTSGYASISYEMKELKAADVLRLDILVAEDVVPAFTRIVARHQVEDEGRRIVEKLHKTLPKQQFTTKIQASAGGRIVASETLSAMKKNVTGHLYGGDYTRKMKLWEKQKEGKKRLLEHRGKVSIPQDVFIKMVQSGE